MQGGTERRGRGRPKGSTRYAQKDAETIARAADLMIRDRRLSVSAAIKQATGKPADETLIHRLRCKMKPQLDNRLAEARARAAQQTKASPDTSFIRDLARAFVPTPETQAMMRQMAQAAERMKAFMPTPETQEMMRQMAQAAERMKAFLPSSEVQEMMRGLTHTAEYLRASILKPEIQEVMRGIVDHAKHYDDAFKATGLVSLQWPPEYRS